MNSPAEASSPVSKTGLEALAGDMPQPPAEASSPVSIAGLEALAGDMPQPPAEASSPVSTIHYPLSTNDPLPT